MRELVLTPRNELRERCFVNTHFSFNPSVYGQNGKVNSDLVQAIIDGGFGGVRERIWPHNVGQQVAFKQLMEAGLKGYCAVGDMSYTPAKIAVEIGILAKSSLAPFIKALTGPNEANANGGDKWAARVVELQQAIYTEARKHEELNNAIIVGPALKHNIPHDKNYELLDADYRALAAAGITKWCDAGDFHFYPGETGPVLNQSEAIRAAQAYGELPLFNSETGWTEADIKQAISGPFSAEAYVRGFLDGRLAVALYEFADEKPWTAGREGMFGVWKKLAYDYVSTLLATPDGGAPFPGWLGRADREESDVKYLCLSNPTGWSLKLVPGLDTEVVVVLREGYEIAGLSWVPGDDHPEYRRYTVPLAGYTELEVTPI